MLGGWQPVLAQPQSQPRSITERFGRPRPESPPTLTQPRPPAPPLPPRVPQIAAPQGMALAPAVPSVAAPVSASAAAPLLDPRGYTILAQCREHGQTEREKARCGCAIPPFWAELAPRDRLVMYVIFRGRGGDDTARQEAAAIVAESQIEKTEQDEVLARLMPRMQALENECRAKLPATESSLPPGIMPDPIGRPGLRLAPGDGLPAGVAPALPSGGLALPGPTPPG